VVKCFRTENVTKKDRTKLKSKVIYYSETGNTQKLAQAIASGMKCEAKSIHEIDAKAVDGYDNVCFCSPVQGWQPAARMLGFIKLLTPVSNKHAITGFTMHLGGSGRAAKIIKRELEKKGYIVLGSYCCLGWSRLVANFGPRIFKRGHPNTKELEQSSTFGDSFLRKQEFIS
jgi:flavodoxin